METKSLKINIPEGFEIDKEKSTLEEIIFKPIIKKGLPKSWEELENINGYYVENSSIPEYYATSGRVETTDKNIFPSLEEAKAAIALAQLCQLRDIYNEGWKPDWGNTTIKYIIYIAANKIAVSQYKTF